MELREIARPYLEKLSRECNKTVNLAILDKFEMVYIERVRVPGIRDLQYQHRQQNTGMEDGGGQGCFGLP